MVIRTELEYSVPYTQRATTEQYRTACALITRNLLSAAAAAAFPGGMDQTEALLWGPIQEQINEEAREIEINESQFQFIVRAFNGMDTKTMRVKPDAAPWLNVFLKHLEELSAARQPKD